METPPWERGVSVHARWLSFESVLMTRTSAPSSWNSFARSELQGQEEEECRFEEWAIRIFRWTYKAVSSDGHTYVQSSG